MQRSSRMSYRLARLVGCCLFALSTLFLVSSSKPWAAGKLTGDYSDIQSTAVELKNNSTVSFPVVPTPNFTLNQYVYPGSTTFSSLSPTLTTSPPASALTAWSIGVPVVHVLTIGNSNPAQTNLITINLKDSISPALDPNFVILKVSCDAFGGAVCPYANNVLPAGTTLPLVVPGIQIKVGTEVVVRVVGYYKTTGSFQNSFSVFDPQNQSATEEQGPPKAVQIVNNWLPIDLKVAKTSSTTSTSFSTTSPASIHYTITLTGDPSQDFYPGNLLTIRDYLSSGFPPLPSYSITGFVCTNSGGSTCPAAPTPAIPGVSFSSSMGTSSASTDLIWPSGPSTVIKKGATVTLDFDVEVKAQTGCGSSSMTIQNQASILMNGFTYSDSVGNNNASPPTSNTFTTGFVPCSTTAAGSITKTRVCPSSGCPIVSWGSTVPYEIKVKNNSNTAKTFRVSDYISKQSITAPFRASLAPNQLPSDVHCTPSTVVCTTTPVSSVPPQDVFLDTHSYLLFQTDFTLQASGQTGDNVTLSFGVKIDKLADCQTNPDNFFTNSASLSLVSSTSVIDVASTYPGVIAQIQDLPLCQMKVTKTMDQPANGIITFGQPVSYTVTYENLGSQPLTVHSLRDALNMRNPTNPNVYGDIPITNLAASCTSPNGVSPMPNYQLTATKISPSFPEFGGTVVIQEASVATGITFPGPSKLQCTVSFTPQAPSPTDNFCQGKGTPELVNSAYMDVSAVQTYGVSVQPSPPYFAQVAAPLPLCRKVSVLKTIGNGVTSTGPGGLLTFQINITNYGNDPVSNFILTDPLPPGFNYVNGSLVCAPASACSGPGFSSNTLTENFNPIPPAPQNLVTLTYQVNASTAGGTYPNTATGSFGTTSGTNFYFEGDPNVLLVNSAQVQVLTPTLTKSFQPNSIVYNGTSVLTFKVKNQTGDPAQAGISFTDLLPSGVTVVSAPPTACGGTVSVSGGNSITLSNGSLNPGQASCQFSVTVKATLCGALLNDRTRFSSVSNLDVTNAADTLTVSECPNIPTPPTLSKSFEPNQISANGISTLGFTITNSSGDPKQTGISFSDTLPVGLQFVSVASNGCSGNVSISSDGQTVTLTGAQLIGPNADGSGKHSCQIIVKVKATDACGVYKNTEENFSQVTNLDVSGINQQLEVVGCGGETCEVKTKEISCKADGTGGYLYTFTVTNHTGHTVTDILLTPPAGSGLTLSDQQISLLPGGLANGASLTLQVTIKGGQPQQEACIDLTLMTQDGQCCTTRVCPVLPECCGTAKDESIVCNPDGSYTYTLAIVNTGVNTIEHIYLYPPAGVTMTPDYFAVSLKPGDTFTTKVTIKGAKPGDKLCFDISLHTANMENCCKGQHCIVLPACSAYGVR